MAERKIRVRYDGAPEVITRDVDGTKLVVHKGDEFLVDEATATRLIATNAGFGRVLKGEMFPGDGDLTPTNGIDAYKALQAEAVSLGVPAKGKATDLQAAVDAAKANLAAEAAQAAAAGGTGDQGGEDASRQPGNDPAASATGEPGTPPSTELPLVDAITLGDLPPYAVVAE